MVHAGTCPMGEECPENVSYILLWVSSSSTPVSIFCLAFCQLLRGVDAPGSAAIMGLYLSPLRDQFPAPVR